MKISEEGQLLRIFIGESDKWNGKPLYEALVLKAVRWVLQERQWCGFNGVWSRESHSHRENPSTFGGLAGDS
jgi:PII-like signaling protein